MANTYAQLHIQLVFAVKGRESLIDKSWREDLYRYITGIVQQHGHKMLQVNCMSDHIHIFIGYNPNQKIPDLVETIKTDTNRYIKRNRLCKSHFRWQTGYGAYSYARSQVGRVVKYIANQEEHHRIKTFMEEYTTMLSRFDIDYEEMYSFEFLDVHSW